MTLPTCTIPEVRCPHCREPFADATIHLFEAGPHYKAMCADCGRYIKHVPKADVYRHVNLDKIIHGKPEGEPPDKQQTFF